MSYTVGDIARKLERSQHTIVYAIRSAHIEPAFRVGIFRMFTDEQLGLIEAELSRIAAKHEKGAARDAATVSA